MENMPLSEKQSDIRVNSTITETSNEATGKRTPCNNKPILHFEDEELNLNLNMMEESIDNESNDSTLVHATFSLPLSFRCEQRILRLVSECKTRKFVKDTDGRKKCKLIIMEIWNTYAGKSA